jgi:hypothetical protein
MALSANLDLSTLSATTERKPEKTGGVSVSQIPPALIALLEREVPNALKDVDNRIVLALPVIVPGKAPTDKSTDEEKKAYADAEDQARAQAISDVKQLALYASAWGKGRPNGKDETGAYHEDKDERFYIVRVANKAEKDEPIVRLKVQKWTDVPKDNRPGRR